jgi:hypothetical protein
MPRLPLLVICLTLAACSNAVQTTSGAAFLAARDTVTDPDILAAAAIEPDLQLPANIGIARINSGILTMPMDSELAVLANTRPNPDPLGQFTVVSPLIAQTLTNIDTRNPLRIAQLTAARQHMDYVLIYDLTQDGRGFSAMGRGQVIFMDVRTGYVYGTAATDTSVAGYGRARLGWRNAAVSDGAAAKIITALTPDVQTMLANLVLRAAS